jgi:hypothetical protein
VQRICRTDAELEQYQLYSELDSCGLIKKENDLLTEQVIFYIVGADIIRPHNAELFRTLHGPMRSSSPMKAARLFKCPTALRIFT